MVPVVVDQAWLAAHPGAVLADVRWYPDGRDPAGAYGAGHLPGAVPVDLDRWLAAPPSAAGRHPLPDPATFAAGLAAAGIGTGDVVVGYDDAGGVIAARLVWMLRAWGVDAALLDGGLLAWDGPLETGPPPAPRPPREPVAPRPWPVSLLADVAEVEAVSADAAAGRPAPAVVLDARPADRYAGAPDALDPRAGHIPGARSLPARANVGEDGRLLPAAELRRRLDAAGAGGGAGVISSCGSGVTACHTLLLLEHVGLAPGRLYPGSWSEWSRSDRPAATGPDPA
jgi:thiosulfate/3-mercaptopyruvate sulfurtransferase